MNWRFSFYGTDEESVAVQPYRRAGGCPRDLKGQKKDLMDYAEQMVFDVVGSTADIGNGLDYECSRLNEIMKAAANGEFDVLLIKKLDRLGRDTIKTLELLSGSHQLGIRIYSPLEGEILISRLP